jgi:hypothetical protein
MIATAPVSRAALAGMTACCALLALPAAAQDSCELKLKAAVGERRLVTVESAVDATLTAVDLEEKATTRSVASQRKDSFVEETVVVDDRREPIQVRLSCLSSTVEERAAGDVSGGVRKTPVQGRVVTVTREGAGWTVIPLGADPLAAELTAPLGRWLDLRLLLKDGAVKVGESWAVSGADRLAAMAVGKDAGVPEIRCTLGRIVPGTPAKAEIAVTVRMETGKEGDESRLQGQLAGLLVIDLAAGKPLSFSLSGSFKAGHAARDANGSPVGRVEIQARQVALKFAFEPAGKP